ncbi:MAG TPA: hypothetical protein VG269_26860 [Tepidisphaeraceae bacterium]|nr:hypothetical protein [Tepidisphaeraceae bacterium]
MAKPIPKISVQLGRLLPMVECYAEVLGEGKVNKLDRSHLIRECLEDGLKRAMQKLSPEQRRRIEQAGAAAA